MVKSWQTTIGNYRQARVWLHNFWQRELRLKTYRCTGCGLIMRQRRHGDRLKLHDCHPAGRIMEYLYRG